MNYGEAIAYINELNSRGIALGLERITALLEELGNPQEALRCIHVAGTNGKGSVCAFLAAALQKAGLRIGRYSSPSVYGYLERFQINGGWMREEEFASLTAIVKQACTRMREQNLEQPTVFEVETAVAFLYFKQQNCDYVLLETGMGGRLDSTNVITRPVVSVITSISFDHTAMLGSTLAEIAAEKGGIIKNGCPAVIGPQKPEAMAVLKARCASCGITPILSDEAALKRELWSLEGQQFSYGRWNHMVTTLLGDYQCTNAMIALDALQFLQTIEPALNDDAIRDGIRMARWPGRFEVLCRHPLVIVDGAHNPDGARVLADTIQKHFPEKTVHLLMAVFKDKEYTEIARIMSTCSDTICCFRPGQERGLEAAVLAKEVQPFYRRVQTADSAEQAVKQVFGQAGWNEMIVSFGSLSTIQEVQNAVLRITEQEEMPHGTGFHSDEAN